MTWPITLTFDDLKMNCIFRMVYIGLKKLVATGRPPSGLPNASVDFPAIAAAHNLLSAMLDAHLHFGNELDIGEGWILVDGVEK